MYNCKRIIKFTTIVSIFIFTEIGCKKQTADSVLPSRTSFEHSVFYKVVYTIPSPADSARGYFEDSIKVKKINLWSDPNFYANIPHVSANSIPGFPGFSFGYEDRSNFPFPYFAFTSYAFPNVPREFELNRPYENITDQGSLHAYPFFLGNHNGSGGMNYFVNNILPPDAHYPPIIKTYTKIIFTDKIKILVSTVDTVLLASGKIAGYAEQYWGTVNPGKYLQRWDFTVEFSDLNIFK